MNTKVYRKIIISMIMLNFYMKLSAPYPMICIITFIYYIYYIKNKQEKGGYICQKE